MKLLCLACLASLAATPQATFRVESRLVEVHATVIDHHGRFVDGLTREQFEVRDNGERQDLVSFESNSTALSCAIVIDNTASMRGALPHVKNAVSHLIDSLRAEDTVAIYSFNTALVPLTDFTVDKADAKRVLQPLRAQGRTALFDAIAEVAGAISRRNGKKAMLVFTDGADNASLLYQAAAETRARESGIPIYTIVEGEALSEASLKKLLHDLANKTGGKAYEIRKPHEMANVFGDIIAELRHTYLMVYRPPASSRKLLHNIQIEVADLRNYKVRGRQSYWSD